ncbi:MAG: hypothetical protein K1X57_23145 [Gemmataceae bacterium]|nr:hypothetical protein [Gemmataceae bacterium]
MPRRNRIWIWFFAVLTALSAAAISINWVYNQRMQLTPEALEAARTRWAEKGLADYDLRIRKEINSAANDTTAPESIVVKVRAKRVTDVTLNGRALEPRLWPKYDVDAWFDYIEEFLERDRAKGTPVYSVLDADPADGHPLRYIRRVKGARERQELLFDLKPFGTSP